MADMWKSDGLIRRERTRKPMKLCGAAKGPNSFRCAGDCRWLQGKMPLEGVNGAKPVNGHWTQVVWRSNTGRSVVDALNAL